MGEVHVYICSSQQGRGKNKSVFFHSKPSVGTCCSSEAQNFQKLGIYQARFLNGFCHNIFIQNVSIQHQCFISSCRKASRKHTGFYCAQLLDHLAQQVLQLHVLESWARVNQSSRKPCSRTKPRKKKDLGVVAEGNS